MEKIPQDENVEKGGEIITNEEMERRAEEFFSKRNLGRQYVVQLGTYAKQDNREETMPWSAPDAPNRDGRVFVYNRHNNVIAEEWVFNRETGTFELKGNYNNLSIKDVC